MGSLSINGISLFEEKRLYPFAETGKSGGRTNNTRQIIANCGSIKGNNVTVLALVCIDG